MPDGQYLHSTIVPASIDAPSKFQDSTTCRSGTRYCWACDHVRSGNRPLVSKHLCGYFAAKGDFSGRRRRRCSSDTWHTCEASSRLLAPCCKATWQVRVKSVFEAKNGAMTLNINVTLLWHNTLTSCSSKTATISQRRHHHTMNDMV